MNTELQAIFELTREVSALTERGAWAEATELDQQRQTRLRAFCAGLNPQLASPELIQALTEIVQLNDGLIGSVQHQQRALLRDAETVRVGQRAIAAYSAGSGALAYTR